MRDSSNGPALFVDDLDALRVLQLVPCVALAALVVRGALGELEGGAVFAKLLVPAASGTGTNLCA